MSSAENTSKTGTDAAQALRLVSRAEPTWTPAKIAAELGIHPRTVTRWEADQHQPSAGNRRALKDLIQRMRRDLAMAPYLRYAADGRLAQALECLLTAAERAERDRRRAEADERRQAQEAAEEEAEQRRIAALVAQNRARDAQLSGRVPAQRQPVRSVVAELTDPFAAVDRDPAMALAEGAFA